MSFDKNSAASVYTIIKKNPKNTQFDWFVIGLLYGHPNNSKSLDEIFNNVNNITSLSREGALGLDDTNDFLIRMISNLQTAKIGANGVSKNVLSNDQKDQRNGHGAANGQSGSQRNGVIRKTSTIELDENEEKVLGDDVSYKSNNKTENMSEPGDGLEELDDLAGGSTAKKVNLKRGSPQPHQDAQSKYIRKPIDEINIADLLDNPKALRRHTTLEEEALSMELIKQLQEEENKMNREIDDRKKKEDEQMNDIMCSICLCGLVDEDFIPLEECEHMFHTNCFSEFLKSEINSRHFPIKCPSNCGVEVSSADMVQVLDQDLVDKFYDYSLQRYVATHADEISCCPTPNCTYAFVQNEDGSEDDNVLTCPLCKKKYCLNCRVDFHKGMTCKEYQINNKRDENDIKFEKFVKGKKYKQCSKCKFWVEKNQGCDHMTCRCKYEFCYKCGGKYRECECMKKLQEQMQQRQQQAVARAQARRQTKTAAAAGKRRKR